MKKNYCVLGGGTAGWFTALFIKKLFPSDNVKLIQGESTGAIGVGEGTVPNIIDFLLKLEIDPIDVLKNTKGTIKNGISFENWNGDGKKYFHSFNSVYTNDFKIKNIFDCGCEDFYLKHLMQNNLDFSEYDYISKLSYENLIDLDRTEFALHFDAQLLSEYLQKVGLEKGIEIVTGDFSHVEKTNTGFIENINLTNGIKFNVDFIFDCSGFARLLIDKVFKEKWISYSKHLPMKKGIAFWLDQDKKINPYTSAIALDYGWLWKIPLQHRIGAGYIFDSDYIDEQQALDEAQTYFKEDLNVRKVIPFEAGRYENVWSKNCMAVGLSAGFVEPLEATSLFLTIQQLETFKHFINETKNPNQKSLDLFNEIIANNMDDTLCFLYLHYMTKRNTSKFWKNFKNDYVIPSKLQARLDNIKENNLRYFDFSYTKTTGNFELSNYLKIINGLEINSNKINLHGYEEISPKPSEYKKTIKKVLKHGVEHAHFLSHMSSSSNG